MSDSIRFFYHCFRRDISNFSLFKHRNYDGFLISMHQSGTHWLKHMLAMAITSKYELPPPKYMHADDIIAGIKHSAIHDIIPRIVFSHSIPHALVSSAFVRQRVSLPPYVILVRDIRSTLVSNYEKRKDIYQCDFSTYLRGDISGHEYNNDIWWTIRFYNSWGKILSRFPESTLLVRYEDIKQDPLTYLKKINQFWKLELTDELLQYAIDESSKEKMLKKYDPDAPTGVIRKSGKSPREWFSDEDESYYQKTCKKHLKYTLNYPFD